MDGLLRSLFDRDGPSETAGAVGLCDYRKADSLSANRETGRSLRRWWQPQRTFQGSPLVTSRMSGQPATRHRR